MSTKTRRAKFADVKVGDVVSIRNRDGTLYDVFEVSHVIAANGCFSCSDLHFSEFIWFNAAGNENRSISGRNQPLKADHPTPAEARKFKQKKRRKELSQDLGCRVLNYGCVTLSQLRRIRAILEETKE